MILLLFQVLFQQSGIPDPLLKMNKKNLQEICQEARQSSIYKMVKYNDNRDLPEAIILDETYYKLPTDIIKKEYKEIEYYVRKSLLKHPVKNEVIATKEANILNCATKVEDRHFHLTYGFLDGYFFIFNRVFSINGEETTDEGIKLLGVVEPTPDLIQFRDHQHMEKVFLNSMHNIREYLM